MWTKRIDDCYSDNVSVSGEQKGLMVVTVTTSLSQVDKKSDDCYSDNVSVSCGQKGLMIITVQTSLSQVDKKEFQMLIARRYQSAKEASERQLYWYVRYIMLIGCIRK